MVFEENDNSWNRWRNILLGVSLFGSTEEIIKDNN